MTGHLDAETVLRSTNIPAFFSSRLLDIKPNGSKDIKARCPFCGCKASFSANLLNGRWHCFHEGCNASGTLFQFVERQDGVDFQTALATVHAAATGTTAARFEPKPATKARKKLEDLPAHAARYDYTLDEGTGRAVKLRFEKPDGKKAFAWYEVDSDGGYREGLGDRKPDLYNYEAALAGIERGATIILSEGEKATDRTTQHDGDDSLDYVATCGPYGSASFNRENGERLACQLALARDVLVVVDRDDDGEKWAEEARRHLEVRVAKMRFLRSKAATPKADLYDHLEAGFSLGELLPLAPEAAEPEEPDWIKGEASSLPTLPPGVLVGMASVVAKMPSYAAGSIVRDIGLHLWWSRPGNLKTYLAILLVLEMTQREAGDLLFGIPGLVIVRPWKKLVWLGDEETGEEWKARAEAVARGNGLRPPGDEILFADASGGPCLLNLDHVPRLLDLAGPDVSAVFADPLANLGPDRDADGRPVKVDLDNPHALHRVCRPLRRLAKQREIGVFLLHHANASGERERGPTAYRGSADVVAELKYDSDILTLIDHKNRDRAKGRFSFRPVWEDGPAGLSVRFERAAEPVATAARGLKGAARAMYAAAQAGAGQITHAELMRTKIPGKDTEDVSSRTKRRAWTELVEARLVCEDKGVVRLLSQTNRSDGDSDTSGHETDTDSL